MGEQSRKPSTSERSERGAPSDGPAVPELEIAPRASQRMRAYTPPPSAPAPPVAIVDDDADDFDMQIERNLGSSGLPTAFSSRARDPGRSMAPVAKASGLELDALPTNRRVHDDDDDEPSVLATIAGLAGGGVIMGGSAFALVHFAHRAGGMKLTALLPRAFDGTSAAESAVAAVTALVLAVALGFAGVKMAPRSWALVGAAAASLFVSLAMVTVALASSGEAGAPPDGALLVPYLAPAAIAGIALAIAGRSGWLLAGRRSSHDRGIARRLAAIPLAAIGGAVLYLAYETSTLGTG